MKRSELIEVASKWHPAILVALTVIFGVLTLFSVVLLIKGNLNSVGALLISVGGASWFGKSLARKYAAELAAIKAEQDKLNS